MTKSKNKRPTEKSMNKLKENVTQSLNRGEIMDSDNINPRSQHALRGFGRTAVTSIMPLKSLNR
jgi:hypothetical protein